MIGYIYIFKYDDGKYATKVFYFLFNNEFN
jgi:hypothetical protein